MRGKGIRILSLVLSLTFVVGIVGCSNDSKDSKDKSKSEMGRYVEERYETIKNGYIQQITKREDGNIMAMTYNQQGKRTIIKSQDGGKSWEDSRLALPNEEGKDTVVDELLYLKNGNILIRYYFRTPESAIVEGQKASNSQEKYGVIDKDNNFKEVTLKYTDDESAEEIADGRPQQLKGSANGDIFLSNKRGDKVIQLDGETFEEKYVYQYNDSFNDFSIVGDSLVIYGFSSIMEYDINTGEEKGNLEELQKETIEAQASDNPMFIDSGSKDKLYYYSQLGLYCYDMKEQTVKMIIDGALSSFGSTDMTLSALLEMENNEFLAIFNDRSANETSIVNYKYDENIASVPDNKIRVYSLFENESLRRAISNYSKLHPDTYVKYEIGLTLGEEGVTESDVLKTLNTEIMAGDGPDIILLDGLPGESYAEKGLLEDISDVISEVSENDKLFKNIVEAYKVDGKIYKFPTKIKYPMLFGNMELINSITDFNSLVEVTKKLAKETPNKKIFDNLSSPESIVYALYYLYGSKGLNEDNTINEEELTKFFTAAKEIYTAVDETNKKYGGNAEVTPDKDEEQIDKFEESNTYYELRDALSPSIYPDNLLNGNDAPHLILGSIDSQFGYTSTISTLNNDKNLGYKILSRDDEKIFIPIDTVSINAKSKNKENAKEVLKGLLSYESNSGSMSDGLPVNKEQLRKAFDIENREDDKIKFDEETQHYTKGSWTNILPDGTAQEIKQLYPNEDDVNKLIGEIEGLNVATTLNSVFIIEVAKQFEEFALGNKSIDDAIKAIVDNLDLYLSE